MRKLKHLKTFEGMDDAEDAGLYDIMTELITNATLLYQKFTGEEDDDFLGRVMDPEEARESLGEIPESHELYDEAQDLITQIDDIETQIDETDAEEYFTDDEDYDEDDDSDDIYEGKSHKINERIDFKEIGKVLTTLKTKKEIDKWVENFLSVADDYDFAQQELLSYVIEMEFDDEELRLLWMDVIQSY
jgi:hypothetical protein